MRGAPARGDYERSVRVQGAQTREEKERGARRVRVARAGGVRGKHEGSARGAQEERDNERKTKAVRAQGEHERSASARGTQGEYLRDTEGAREEGDRPRSARGA